MAKAQCVCSLLLLSLMVAISLFILFGDLLFGIDFFSRTVNIQQLQIEPTANISPANTQTKPIFFDQDRFITLTEHHSKINSQHPTSWIHLHNQLFCPIKYSLTLNPINAISNGAERLLKAIYELQFPTHCTDIKDHQFLILDIALAQQNGLGAITNGLLIKFLFRALITNRTLLLHGKWSWSSLACSRHNALECYFMSVSNCNVTQILEYAKQHTSDYHIGKIPDVNVCNLGNFDDEKYSIAPCTHQIIHINESERGMLYHPIMQTINDKTMQKYLCNYQCFRAVAISFMYRLQPTALRIIFNKIQHSIIQSIDETFNPIDTISLPIRATDKCRKLKVAGGEMDCWTVSEYVHFLQSVKYLSFGRINTVIITSESDEMIDGIKDIIDIDNGWNVILNLDDTRPKSGSAKTNKISGLELEHDVIIGALSSLLLQMNSKYIAFTRSSNWLDNIWNIAEELNCEQIFWKDMLMYDDNYYFSFNKQCFEFRQNGVLNKKVHHKHILYPMDLWDVIHGKNLTPNDFHAMFGVNITKAGWDTYCARYKESPFVDALHIV